MFVLAQRKGWKIDSEKKTYEERSDKDLSTYAPDMTFAIEITSLMLSQQEVEIAGNRAATMHVWLSRSFSFA